jgi:glucokinase
LKVLAGDVGGTKSLLAIIDVDTNEPAYRILHEQRYDSKRFDSLGEIAQEFVQQAKLGTDRACFGVACPVSDGECDATNLPWHIEKSEIAEKIGIRAELINDFEAIGYGLGLLKPKDLATLQEGSPKSGAPIALLGAGTGLGEAFLIWQDKRYHVHSSEGGHVDFAPRNDLEIDLLKFMQAREQHVSYERLVSGPGLITIYRFLIESQAMPENAKVRAEMETGDKAAVVSEHGLDGSDATCGRAVDIFVSIYGAEAGNLALKVLAAAGVYVAGGIAPHIIDKLRDGAFMRSFREKGRLSSFVESVPVHVILNPKVGLLGAALVAAHLE